MAPRMFSVLAIAAACVVAPFSAQADCGENCSLGCSGYSDPQEWDACMYPCLQACLETEEWVPPVPEPEAVPEDQSRLLDEGSVDKSTQYLCINEGYACVLNGTECCGTATCQGTFPNTTCKQ